MSTGDSSEWIWKVLGWLPEAIATVLATIFALLLRQYKADRAMLLEHEQRLKEHDDELDEQSRINEYTDDGRKLFNQLEHVANRMDSFQRWRERTDLEVKVLHDRVNRMDVVITEIGTDLRWIRNALNRRLPDKEDEQ